MQVEKGGCLAYVAPYLPPHIGGMENVAQTIAEGMAAHQPVEVFTSRTGAEKVATVERRGNLTVRRLFTIEVAHLPFLPTLLFHLLCLPRRTLVHVHVAQAYLPEVVWISSVLRRRPFVAHFHLDVEPSGPLGPIFVAYKRWVLGPMLRAASRIIVLSGQQAEFLRQRYRVDPRRIVVVPNGVSACFADVRGPRSSHGGAFRLLFVGRLAPQKNLPLLLKALSRVNAPVELTVVGDGEDRSMIERLISELRLEKVRLVGVQRGDALLDWYRWADAFVIPSEREGMPLVVLEAMAAGLPLIGTNVPGVADTIGDDGIVVSPEPDALAGAIESLISDASLVARLADRSRARGRAYSWTGVIARLRTVYGEVTA